MMPEELAAVAARAERIVVMTGAGVSAESGIGTFRGGPDSLWSKHDPVMLASIEGFRRDPALVWRWYDERRQQLKSAEPNPGHHALAEWQQLWLELGRSFTLVTQNIDDLHNIAGSSAVMELHGNIWHVRPLDSPHSEACRFDDCPLSGHPPYDSAGRMLRPHVVWFGEMLDNSLLEEAARQAAACDLFISIGTSAAVYPAAGLAHVALHSGAFTAEIDPNETEFSALAHISLRGLSGALLPRLLTDVRRHLG